MGRYALGNGFRSFTQLVLMVECHDSKNNGIQPYTPTLLNKRTELISKCRHENKFYLANFELNR